MHSSDIVLDIYSSSHILLCTLPPMSNDRYMSNDHPPVRRQLLGGTPGKTPTFGRDFFAQPINLTWVFSLFPSRDTECKAVRQYLSTERSKNVEQSIIEPHFGGRTLHLTAPKARRNFFGTPLCPTTTPLVRRQLFSAFGVVRRQNELNLTTPPGKMPDSSGHWT